MKCPYFVDEQHTWDAQCRATVVPFEPSRIDQIDYCTMSRHLYCPLYRNACGDLSLEIHKEVLRAVG